MNVRSMLLAITCSALPLSGCAPVAPVYSMPPVSAKVVDAETGMPVAGAVVVANWSLSSATPHLMHGTKQWGLIEVRETVTDADGRFTIEGMSRPSPGTVNALVSIFKGGYQLSSVSLGPWLDGKVVKLGRPQPSRVGSTGETFYMLDASMQVSSIVDDCQWHKIPRMLAAMDAEARRIRAEHPSARVIVPRRPEGGATCVRPGGAG